MLARALWGAACLCITLTTTALAADTGKRTWDPDLKRWLTEQELGSIEVYLTEEQALKIEATSTHAAEHRAARVKLSASTWPPSQAPQQ